MPRKKVTAVVEKISYTLPSKNDVLRNYLVRNKTLLQEKIVSAIEYALLHNLNVVDIFDFENTDFIISIYPKDFNTNLEYIFKSYIQSENYELCTRIVRLQNVIKNQSKTDEKETKISG